HPRMGRERRPDRRQHDGDDAGRAGDAHDRPADALGRLGDPGVRQPLPGAEGAVYEVIAAVHRAIGAFALARRAVVAGADRRHAPNEQLKATMHEASGLPTTTMSTGVVDGLRAMGVRRVAVGTAYIEEVNARLRQFLVDSGFDVLAVEGLGIDVVGQAGNVP